jgi:hypothetical protein
MVLVLSGKFAETLTDFAFIEAPAAVDIEKWNLPPRRQVP